MTLLQRYQRKAQYVTAVQFDGTDECAVKLGLEIRVYPTHKYHKGYLKVVFCITGSGQHAHIRMGLFKDWWIVTDALGFEEVLTDQEFHERYEAVPEPKE